MNDEKSKIIEDAKSRIVGLECWYVAAGKGATGTTFSLALGDKILRDRPLINTKLSEEYRRFKASVSLLVWCAWRLDGDEAPETSWDDSDDRFSVVLDGLVGSRVIEANIALPAWDLQLTFSPYRRMHVFCDHVPGEPSIDINWELFDAKGRSMHFGPGAQFEYS